MTIRTPFYFVICIEGGDDASPQPLMDAEQYQVFNGDDDDDNDDSSYSTAYTDVSDDASMLDAADSVYADHVVELDMAPSSRIRCDEACSHEASPPVENDSCLVAGFEEWEEHINDVDNDLDSIALADKRVRRIEGRRRAPPSDSSS